MTDRFSSVLVFAVRGVFFFVHTSCTIPPFRNTISSTIYTKLTASRSNDFGTRMFLVIYLDSWFGVLYSGSASWIAGGIFLLPCIL
jgi:hypothetical protein